MGPHLTQCGRGRGLPPCQVSSSSIQLFGHNTPTSQTNGTDRQDSQRSDSIRRTVLQTVVQKEATEKPLLQVAPTSLATFSSSLNFLLAVTYFYSFQFSLLFSYGVVTRFPTSFSLFNQLPIHIRTFHHVTVNCDLDLRTSLNIVVGKKQNQKPSNLALLKTHNLSVMLHMVLPVGLVSSVLTNIN